MPANTTKHGFTYPVVTDLAGTGDTAIQTLATQLDTKLSMPISGSVKFVDNIVQFEYSAPNVPGFIVIHTNLTATTDVMVTLRLKGYSYQAEDNTMDITISMYCNAAFAYGTEVISNGNFKIKEVYLITKTDGKLAVAIRPDTTAGYWHYPKMWVDALFGHTMPSDTTILTGWSMDIPAALPAGTIVKTLTTAMWIPVTTFSNGWVNYDAARTAQYTKTADGWVKFRGLIKSGTMGAGAFNVPVGYRPHPRVDGQHYLPVASIDQFGCVGVWSDGGVVPLSGSNIWVDLSGLTYRAAPPGPVGT